MKKRESESEFDVVLNIILQHRARALNNVNVENLLTNWEIGAFISQRLANSSWGGATVDGLVDYIHSHDPTAKGYGRRNLYNMVAVYEAFASAEFAALLSRSGKFVQPTAAQIGCDEIMQPSAAQLTKREIVQPAAGQTMPNVLYLATFTNLVEIINRVHTPQEWLFYIVYAHRENLRKLELRRCLVNDTYSTLLGGEKKNFSAAMKRLYPAAPVRLKDTALVDFLNLPERHRERQLRRSERCRVCALAHDEPGHDCRIQAHADTKRGASTHLRRLSGLARIASGDRGGRWRRSRRERPTCDCHAEASSFAPSRSGIGGTAF